MNRFPKRRSPSSDKSSNGSFYKKGADFCSDFYSKSVSSDTSPQSVTRASKDAALRPDLVPRTASAPLIPSSCNTTPWTHGEDAIDNHRNSVASIVDDPFFRNYTSPQTVSLGRDLKAATNAGFLEHERFLYEQPRLAAVRHNIKNLMKETSESEIYNINVAVVGAASVGKSSFIQRALGLGTLPSLNISNARLMEDNIVCEVNLIELNLESLNSSPDNKITWPKLVDDHNFPQVDGVLLLYDVMNEKSIVDIPSTLSSLVTSSLPTTLVSCKCDANESLRKVDINAMERKCFSCIDVVETAASDSESAQLCLAGLLKTILGAMRQYSHPTALSDRANKPEPSSGENPQSSRLSSQHLHHSRSSSKYFNTQDATVSASSSTTFSSDHPVKILSTTLENDRYQTEQHERHNPPLDTIHHSFQADSSSFNGARESAAGQLQSSSLSSAQRFSDQSKLEFESSAGDLASNCTDDTLISHQNDKSYSDISLTVTGVIFDELVDRLTGEMISKADKNFIDVFLCVYRNFAAPGKLFTSILARLELMTNDNETHYLTKTEKQFRILNIISKWISTYPGDFAGPSTFKKLDNFINKLAHEPMFTRVVQEMRQRLQTRVFENDDTGWARTDIDIRSKTTGTHETDLTSLINSSSYTQSEIETGNLSYEKSEIEEIDLKFSKMNYRSSSKSICSGVEENERDAATMVPRNILPLTKTRYQAFMQISDQAFSHELTRIDWLMFSSMRMRDLLRHVSLSIEEKERCKDLSNVNRMINHFNHVARWVASLILLREKAKHRALILEKMVNIAVKLREMNNYYGLAAILAGLNGSAIYRLSQTWSLIPTDVQNRYTSLSTLMGTQDSHSAYRSAWDKSRLPRIPFIPLHRRDIVTAEKGSQTFIGVNEERINWKKFEVLSQVIVPIMKSQMVSYSSLQHSKHARELILDCKVIVDDEEIYQKSLAVENHASTANESGKKKFLWFQK
ncbi:hypothetical protein K3495_g4896 [Podosphaera aphanis]|nr:hypothetical protein K3495_g4896 [Podosphaera aphanis]